MATEKDIRQLLKPEYLRSVKGLELLARTTVAGLLSGLNRSKRTGIGQEFSQYRNYQPGDDLRRLDWKMYARSDKLFVQEAEIETHTTLQFVIDSSASMQHEEDGIQKIDYARYLVATLAWLGQNQGDKIGLFSCNSLKTSLLPASQKQGQFHRLLYRLVEIKAEGEFPANQIINPSLLKANHKQQIVLFITDMYEKTNEISQAIKALNTPRNEVLVFHLMGAKELGLNYTKIATFEDLETGETIQVAQNQMRAGYQKRLEEHLTSTKKQLQNQAITHELLKINESSGKALQKFLALRTKRR